MTFQKFPDEVKRAICVSMSGPPANWPVMNTQYKVETKITNWRRNVTRKREREEPEDTGDDRGRSRTPTPRGAHKTSRRRPNKNHHTPSKKAKQTLEDDDDTDDIEDVDYDEDQERRVPQQPRSKGKMVIRSSTKPTTVHTPQIHTLYFYNDRSAFTTRHPLFIESP